MEEEEESSLRRLVVFYYSLFGKVFWFCSNEATCGCEDMHRSLKRAATPSLQAGWLFIPQRPVFK